MESGWTSASGEATAQTFGASLRAVRLQRGLSLRRVAAAVDISPSYLSKVERDLLPPPAEDKVAALSDVLRLDRDEMLALSGRVSADVAEFLRMNRQAHVQLTKLLAQSCEAQRAVADSLALAAAAAQKDFARLERAAKLMSNVIGPAFEGVSKGEIQSFIDEFAMRVRKHLEHRFDQ